MKRSDYLYGSLDKSILLKQKEICEIKIKKANRLARELLEVPLQLRDSERISAVIEAREFNKKLLKDTIKQIKGLKDDRCKN